MAKTSGIRYEAADLFAQSVGRNGATAEEVEALQDRLEGAKERLLEDWKAGRQGWLGCPDERELLAEVEDYALRLQRKFTTCLVIGIGGSDLGARAVYAALRDKTEGMDLEFLGGNTDPEEIEAVLRHLDLKKTLVNIISKSGDTVEPMAAFLYVRERLIKVVGAKNAARHIVATTDPKSGSLHDFAVKEGFKTFPVPKNIGGRFSVLSAVGLFPLACAGIDVAALLKGAKDIRDSFVKEEASECVPVIFAALHYLADTKRQQCMHVLMPYASSLAEFGRWYRQLWAESLGKRTDRSGKEVFVGPTPIAALGATDQHSQVQLYMDGPSDKVFTFVEVEKFDVSLAVPKKLKGFPGLAYLEGVDFSKIIHAERRATSMALSGACRPNGTLFIPNISARSLGALFMFFEIAVGVMGELYGINAYDQPGVEAGKQAMYRLLGKKH